MGNSGADALLFDFGGVLVNIDFKRALAAWAGAAGTRPETLAARFAFDASFTAHERGEIEDAEYFASLRASLGIDIADAEFLAGWNAIFAGPVAGMQSLLRALATERPLYLFSNTNNAHYEYWSVQYAELLAPFSGVFCSHRIGLRKPAVESFLAVAARTGHAPQRLAFFDDMPENVRGARDAGLAAFRFTAAEWVRTALASLGEDPLR